MTHYPEVWSRPLEDGSIAVGLFNRGASEATVTARWPDLGIRGKHNVRNLWLKQELAPADGSFTTKLPRHGAVLIRLTPAPK